MRPTMLLSFAMLVGCTVWASVPQAHGDVPLTLDTSILGTAWSEQIDPDKDCKFVTDKDALSIGIPGKDHDLWPKDKKMNAPRLLKEVEGDFDVQVRVDVTATLSKKSTAAGRAAYVAAGLLIIPGEAHVFRHEFGLSRQFDGVPYYASHLIHKSGNGGYSYWWEGSRGWKLPKGLRVVWLRLERRESNGISDLNCMASADGKKWVVTTTHGIGRCPTKVKIGLFAVSTSSEPFSPRFDEWKLSPVKSEKK